jgi:hypothetical protein
MNSENAKMIQSQFLKKIENILPKNTTLVNEISDILEISTDSAYRRMRVETYLSIDEIIKLCEHFKISFDAFNQTREGVVSFNYSKLEPSRENFINYQLKLLQDLTIIFNAKERKIIYASEDIPIFHHYRHPVLSYFKMFNWMHSIMSVPQLEHEKFDVNKIDTDLIEIGKQSIERYSNIPSVEIWTETTIQGTLKQIEFFWDSGKFKSEEDAFAVLNSLKEEISLIQKQAEHGTKLFYENGEPNIQEKNYQLYFSEIEITNNCVLVDLGQIKSVYLGHFSFSTMSTVSESYCIETQKWFDIIMKKSILISECSEKQRYQVFKKYFKMIEDLERKVRES